MCDSMYDSVNVIHMLYSKCCYNIEACECCESIRVCVEYGSVSR